MTICYECEKDNGPLSSRSRCVICEHRRAMVNEQYIEDVTAQYYEIVGKYDALLKLVEGNKKRCQFCGSAELIELSSLNQKRCNSCKAIQPWLLDEGQPSKY